MRNPLCWLRGHRWRVTRVEPTREAFVFGDAEPGEYGSLISVGYHESAQPLDRTCKRCGERQVLLMKDTHTGETVWTEYGKESLV